MHGATQHRPHRPHTVPLSWAVQFLFPKCQGSIEKKMYGMMVSQKKKFGLEVYDLNHTREKIALSFNLYTSESETPYKILGLQK